MYSVEVVDTVDSVDAADWDDLSAGTPFAQHRWLRLAELVIAAHEPQYLLLRRDGRLVAAAVGSLERHTGNPTVNARIGWILRRSPILRVGVPILAAPGVLVRATDRTDADLRALLDAVRRLARRRGVLFSTIDNISEADAPAVFATLPRLVPMPADTRLSLVEPSFDDHMRSLPRKKRAEVERVDRRAAEAGVTVRRADVAELPGATLDRMLDTVLDKYGQRLRYLPGMFGRAAELLGEDLTMVVAWRDGELVACATLLRCGDVVAARWMGRDYERTAGTSTYPAVIAGIVRHAFMTGARELRLGSSALDTKKHFGVTVVERGSQFATFGYVSNRAAAAVGRRAPLPGRTRALRVVSTVQDPVRR